MLKKCWNVLCKPQKRPISPEKDAWAHPPGWDVAFEAPRKECVYRNTCDSRGVSWCFHFVWRAMFGLLRYIETFWDMLRQFET